MPMSMRTILIALTLFVSCTSMAQTKVRDLLQTMPDSLAPTLTQNNRLDCIDFKEAGMKAEVRNALGGKSELLTLTSDFADIKLSEGCRMQLCLLDVSQPVDSCQQILCVVSTYGYDIKESTVQFYSLRWRPLPLSRYVLQPSLLQSASPVIATLSPQPATLTVQPSGYLERPAIENQKVIETFPTNLKWENDTFK